MKKELEEALRNVEITCARAQLTRDEHVILSRNIQLLVNTLKEKPKVKEKKNASD